ncbi:MAG: hypothetical protein WCR02_08610 [Sphaerochaetaceae bacterium]|jgi:hypothetical protein
MHKKPLILIALLLLLISSLWGKIREQQLALQQTPLLYATDATIGKLVGNEEQSEVGISSLLLGQEFDLAWLEKYVDPSVRDQFSNTFGVLLSSLLPQSGVSFAKPVIGEDLVTVPARLADGRYLSLTFKAQKLISLAISPKNGLQY